MNVLRPSFTIASFDIMGRFVVDNLVVKLYQPVASCAKPLGVVPSMTPTPYWCTPECVNTTGRMKAYAADNQLGGVDYVAMPSL